MEREVAILIAAVIGGMLSQIHRIFDGFFHFRQRSRIRSLITGDIAAMVEMTDSFNLEQLLPSLTQTGSLPVLVDPELPKDATQEVFFENTAMFSSDEVRSITAFYRHLRATRLAVLSLRDPKNDTEATTLLLSAAKENWRAARRHAVDSGAVKK